MTEAVTCTVIDMNTRQPVEESANRSAVAFRNLFRAYEALRDATDDLASLPVNKLAALRVTDVTNRNIGAAQELWHAEVRLERELHRIRQKQVAIQNFVARKSAV